MKAEEIVNKKFSKLSQIQTWLLKKTFKYSIIQRL